MWILLLALLLSASNSLCLETNLVDIVDNTYYRKVSNKTGSYPDHIFDFVGQEAAKRGINPAIAKAMTLVETNAGTARTKQTATGDFTSNPMRYNYTKERGVVPDFGALAQQQYVSTIADNLVSNAMTDNGQSIRPTDSVITRTANQLAREDSVGKALDYVKDGMKKHPTNLAKAIQFYNGEGKISGAVSPAYNMVGQVDTSKNPVYGKKILEYMKLFGD